MSFDRRQKKDESPHPITQHCVITLRNITAWQPATSSPGSALGHTCHQVPTGPPPEQPSSPHLHLSTLYCTSPSPTLHPDLSPALYLSTPSRFPSLSFSTSLSLSPFLPLSLLALPSPTFQLSTYPHLSTCTISKHITLLSLRNIEQNLYGKLFHTKETDSVNKLLKRNYPNYQNWCGKMLSLDTLLWELKMSNNLRPTLYFPKELLSDSRVADAVRRSRSAKRPARPIHAQHDSLFVRSSTCLRTRAWQRACDSGLIKLYIPLILNQQSKQSQRFSGEN